MTEVESDIFGAGEIFTEYNQHLEKEAEVKEKLREVIKELEAGARDIHTLLQRIHRPGGVKEAGGIVTRAREKFVGVSQKYGELDGKVPAGSYWKYSFLWSNTTSWISFLASLTLYLDPKCSQ